MILCHCLALTDREVRKAAQAGARTTREIGRVAGAGTLCGGCREAIEDLLQRHHAESRPRDPQPAAPAAAG